MASTRSGARHSPARPPCRQLLARAEGVAATIGDGTVSSTDGLIAYLWGQDGRATIEFQMLSVSASAGLIDAGVRVRTVLLPEPDRTPWGERIDVPVDRLRDVITFLKTRLSGGGFGFNTHEGRACVIAHAYIDLQALLNEALAD